MKRINNEKNYQKINKLDEDQIDRKIERQKIIQKEDQVDSRINIDKR